MNEQFLFELVFISFCFDLLSAEWIMQDKLSEIWLRLKTLFRVL